MSLTRKVVFALIHSLTHEKRGKPPGLGKARGERGEIGPRRTVVLGIGVQEMRGENRNRGAALTPHVPPEFCLAPSPVPPDTQAMPN